jgi:16S rRNA (cytidine1402-2'-O)-methyltransferase
MKNKLYIVSVPIGNYDDITLRALKVLEETDVIICEEIKPAKRLLSHYKIDKELIPLNEHTEKEIVTDIIKKITGGKTAALISDAGTPLFSDPGTLLVKLAIVHNIKIIPVPGASSLLAALVGSGFDINNFYYYGWLSPKKEIRKSQLVKLKSLNELIVILETPYRLKNLLNDIEKVFGKNQHIVIAFKLTQPEEKFFRGNVSSVRKKIELQNLKGEFVFLIDNRKGNKNKHRSKL